MMKAGIKMLVKGWKWMARKIGIIQTQIILFVIYALAIGLTAVGMRLLGRDLLRKRIKDESTFWQKKPVHPVDRERLRRQF